MKLSYPVDNEQIFLPHHIIQSGLMGSEGEEYDPDYNPDEEDGDGDDDQEQCDSIDIRFTNIASNAIFFADYFKRGLIKENNIIDLAEAFFELVKLQTELQNGPIKLLDPIGYINNFSCWFEFNEEESMIEIYFKRISNMEGQLGRDLSDKRMDKDIWDILVKRAIYYADFIEYYLATFSVVYAIYDYCRTHKDRIVAIGRYKVGFNNSARNTMTAKRKVLM